MSELKSLPKSPVTKNGKTKVVDTFSATDIVSLYQAQENIDVKKYFQNETVYLLECEDTGYRFYYPFEVAGDEDFYQKLKIEKEKKGLEYDRDWTTDHEFAFKQINEGDKVLEVGCNTGKFLEKVREKTQSVYGLEFNPVAANTAIQKGLNVKNLDIKILAESEFGKYDVVCAFQVLEHITKIQEFLESAVKLLKPNGKLIVSVPDNEPYFQRFGKYEVLNLPPHHLGLWNLEIFKKLTNSYDLRFEKHEYWGQSSLKTDTYLRAKLLANVKSLPRKHSFLDYAKIFCLAPLTLILSGKDHISNKFSFGYISVVFNKNSD